MIFACAGALSLAAAASAAELGEVAVRSFIGQPLSADIELVQLAPDEVSALQVRLAQPDVYRGASITMNPALASVHMSVVRRDGRQFLHLTTTRNIDAEYVHLFLELSAAGRHDVRAATVWLQPDPNPAPLPSAAPVLTAAQMAAQARAAKAAEVVAAAPVEPAPAPTPVRDRTRPAPMPSAHESEVGEPGALRTAPASAPSRRPAVRSVPPRPAAGGEVTQADGGVPLGVAQALLPLPPLPLPKGVKRPAAPAACTPSGMSAKECAVLDTHSVELSSKLVELEGKVKVLQGALAAKGGAAGGAAAAPVLAAAAQPAASGAHGSAASGPAGGHEVAASAAHSASAAPAAAAAAAHSASASASAQAAHGASASAGAAASVASAASAASAAASESASGAASASAEASAPVKKVRVLPKLKYKKEKPPEQPSSNLPLIGAGAGVLALLLGAGGYFYLRKKRGSGPLKIWQGFRKKKPAAEETPPVEAPPLHEVTPESMMER